MRKEDFNLLILVLAILVIMIGIMQPTIVTMVISNSQGQLSIQNFAPIIEPIANITANESDLVTIVVNVSDPNGDPIIINFTAPFNSSGQWQTDFQDSGVYYIIVSASDGALTTTQNVTVTILEVSDIDNDGLPDSTDYLWGFNDDVNTTTIDTNITVNGSSNLSQHFEGNLSTIIRDGNNKTVEFNFSYGPCTLILWQVFIDKQVPNSTLGSVIVKGINSSCILGNKTIYVDNIETNTDRVCVKDIELDNISQISAACDQANETIVDCDNTTQSGFRCNKMSGVYDVNGLQHSGVIEYLCIENWVCTEWGVCSGGTQTRNCTDLNNCGTTLNKPAEAQSCGGAGPPKIPPCTPNWVCSAWQPEPCPPSEIQTRTCNDQNVCGTSQGKPGEIQSCTYTATCNDGIKNQGEEKTDCGGPCAPCPSCNDGIKNQGETGIDCGGPCAACVECITDSDCGPEEECYNGQCVKPVEPVIEKPIEVEEVKVQSLVSCTPGISVTEEEREINLREYKVYGINETYEIGVDIPEDMELVIPPFNVDCFDNKEFITHIALPDNFIELQALRCIGGRCGTEIIRNITDIGCDEEPTQIRREIIRVDELPIQIEPVSIDISKEQLLKTGDYSIRFAKPMEDASVSIKMVEEIEQPFNQKARIAGTPIVLSINTTQKIEELPINISIPYTGEEDEIISLFVYTKDEEGNTQWEIIGGEVDTATKTIKTSIDFTKYAGTKAEIILGPVGLVCPYCFASKFENVFTPKPDSKNSVVLVHGLFATPEIWNEAVNDIASTNQPWQLWTFVYPTGKAIEENAAEFAEQLEQNADRYDTLYLIGHSLGGLIIQQALQIGFIKEYSFVSKVKVVILVGTPNDGSPIALFIKELINKFVNRDFEGPFTLHPDINKQLITGLNIPRIPGIEYHVVAGTRSYDYLGIEVTNRFFNETNDGMVALSSAQHVGEDFLEKECEDYWPRHIIHQDLPSDQRVRKTVEKIIAKSAEERLRNLNLDRPLMGYSNYYELKVQDCSPEDQYLIIGKRISHRESQDEFLCSCGNGVCAGIETATICPEDCIEKVPIYKDYRYISLLIILIIIIILILLLLRRRRKTFADYDVVKGLIYKKKIWKYGKIIVINKSYEKIPEEKRKRMTPISFEKCMVDHVMLKTLKDKKIGKELRQLIITASRLKKAKILTEKEIPEFVKELFKRIKFVNPFKNRKV